MAGGRDRFGLVHLVESLPSGDGDGFEFDSNPSLTFVLLGSSHLALDLSDLLLDAHLDRLLVSVLVSVLVSILLSISSLNSNGSPRDLTNQRNQLVNDER